jgi:F-type H+-transporting ATPase subunit delta
LAVVTSRYARAFADVIFAAKLDPAKTLSDVEALAQLVENSAELRNVLDNPAVPQPQKLKLLDAIIGKLGAQKQVRNFAAILMDNRRLHSLGEIAAQLKKEINERLGFAEAEIVSARELGKAERASLEARLANVTGKRVRARYSRDPKVLGGVIAKVGSTVYDGSIRGQLERMKAAIAG